MKVVRGALGGAGERARFERERVVLAGLSHPNIAALYDGGETRDGQPYYTMEYVDGSAITEFCEANALPAEARVRLLLQVAAGLA
jgi:serine/threonine-protein kinase